MYKYNFMKKLTPAKPMKPMKPSKPAMPKKPMMPRPSKGMMNSCGKSRGCWVKYDLPTC